MVLEKEILNNKEFSTKFEKCALKELSEKQNNKNYSEKGKSISLPLQNRSSIISTLALLTLQVSNLFKGS